MEKESKKLEATQLFILFLVLFILVGFLSPQRSTQNAVDDKQPEQAINKKEETAVKHKQAEDSSQNNDLKGTTKGVAHGSDEKGFNRLIKRKKTGS